MTKNMPPGPPETEILLPLPAVIEGRGRNKRYNVRKIHVGKKVIECKKCKKSLPWSKYTASHLSDRDKPLCNVCRKVTPKAAGGTATPGFYQDLNIEIHKWKERKTQVMAKLEELTILRETLNEEINKTEVLIHEQRLKKVEINEALASFEALMKHIPKE